MGNERRDTAASSEALALWRDLWRRMTVAEAKVRRLELANERLRKRAERAELTGDD